MRMILIDAEVEAETAAATTTKENGMEMRPAPVRETAVVTLTKQKCHADKEVRMQSLA